MLGLIEISFPSDVELAYRRYCACAAVLSVTHDAADRQLTNEAWEHYEELRIRAES